MGAMIRPGLQPSPSGARRVVVKEASQPHANRLKAGFAPARADPTVKLSGKPGQFAREPVEARHKIAREPVESRHKIVWGQMDAQHEIMMGRCAM